MASTRRPWPIAGLAVLVLVAGCLSGGAGGPTRSPDGSPTAGPGSSTPSPATAHESPTPSPTDHRSSPGCAAWVSFYGLDTPGETAWEPDRIAIGYTVQANASVHFVAFENGTVLGSTHVTTTDLEHGVTADGDGIPLDEPLDGAHAIRVGAFADTNGNGRFDAGTDAPCRSDGRAVEAGPRRIDFDSIRYTLTPISTTSTPASTAG